VLFDMDGTLVDTEHLWLQAELLTMLRIGGEWTDADQQHCLGGPLERVVEYMAGKGDPEIVGDLTTQGVGEFLITTMEALLLAEEIRWQPGARTLVCEVVDRSSPTGLVTASWRRLIDAVHLSIAGDLGFEPFTVIVGGDEVPESKPHPAPYLQAAALLGVAPGDCLVIEDSPTGVASGLAAGCRVVAVPHMAPVAAAERLTVIDGLAGWSIEGLWRAAVSPAGSR
jgi:beta-phosphoglucomutase-like phosphatase (HAD superfamily)